MLNLGLTGAFGFLGWHLRAHLYSTKDVQVTSVGHESFNDPSGSGLRDLATTSDVIVHLAGMNRGKDEEIERSNVEATQALINACEAAGRKPHIIFANSTHIDRDTAYGRSKRRSAQMLGAWATRSGAKFSNLIMPGLFGEKGRPFYNSVVSTFCYELANEQRPQVLEDREIELIHAQSAAARILAIARAGDQGEIRMAGRRLTVSALLARLESMSQQYRNHVIPHLDDNFDLALFNIYRSYLFPRHYPVVLPPRSDARGRLVEAVKTLHGGECFVSTTHPGMTRGNHYHMAKIERFLVMHGEARIRVRELFVGDAVEFRVSGATPAYIDMPTFHTHDITNVGTDELTTLFWTHEIFDPDKTDTYSEPVAG